MTRKCIPSPLKLVMLARPGTLFFSETKVDTLTVAFSCSFVRPGEPMDAVLSKFQRSTRQAEERHRLQHDDKDKIDSIVVHVCLLFPFHSSLCRSNMAGGCGK